MRAERVITEYALFGAVAQMRYTEAVATLDADVLVVVPSAERLDVLTPIYEFCAGKGYTLEGESVRVGAWPVWSCPAFVDTEVMRHCTGAPQGSAMRHRGYQ